MALPTLPLFAATGFMWRHGRGDELKRNEMLQRHYPC